MKFASFWCRVATVAVALALTTAPGAVHAQFQPTRTVRIITPFSAGSGPDAALRAIAQGLSAKWGQPVVVDNRPGANGFIAIAAFKAAPSDGHTLINADSSHVAVYPHAMRNLPYDAVRDLEPVRSVQLSRFFVVVSRDSPYRSLDDIVRAAAARPQSVTYGSWFVGSSGHLGGLRLQSLTNTRMLHIPYKDTVQLYTAVANGEVDWAIGSIASAGPLEKSGKLRFIAAVASTRYAAAAQIPAASESALAKRFEVQSGTGIFAPRGTPHAIKEKIAHDIGEVLTTAAMVERYQNFGYEDIKLSTHAYARQIQKESAEWKKLVQESGLRLDE